MIQSVTTLASDAPAGSAVPIIVIAGLAVVVAIVVRRPLPPPPRRPTSADIHRKSVAACKLPQHQYSSGLRHSRHVMRYSCPCGDYRDRRI